MNRKLTLTIEQTTIEKAKNYAKSKGLSLSDIIEHYLKTLTKEQNTDYPEITDMVNALKGSFKVPEDFDYKKELTSSLSDKYIKNETSSD